MTDKPRNPKRKDAPVKTSYYNGKLQCQRCANVIEVRDLNMHHKAVNCSICGQRNDVSQSIKRTL